MQRSSTFNASNISKPSIAQSNSFNNITSITNNFNFSNIKEALKEYEEWRELHCTDNLDFLKRVFNYRLPPSYAASSNNQFHCNVLKCGLKHRIHTSYRRCAATNECEVEYKIHFCDRTKTYVIYERTEEHDHETELFYNNVKGLDPFWENKIIEMLKIRGSKPKVMHNRIIQDYPKLFLGIDDKVNMDWL